MKVASELALQLAHATRIADAEPASGAQFRPREVAHDVGHGLETLLPAALLRP